MKKAVIGIVLRHFKKLGIRPKLYITEEVKDAVIFNNAIPYAIIPTTDNIFPVNLAGESDTCKNLNKIISKTNREFLVEQIKRCDGIILQGGAVADAYEIFVAKYCYENDIPILGICEGQSNLIRAIGGTTKLVENNAKHNQTETPYVHDIEITKDTLFYRVIKKSKIKVNSRHNCTVDDYKMLRVSAIDDDGNIEAVEAPNKKFYLGVRFHPESLSSSDKNHNAIFKALIAASLEK